MGSVFGDRDLGTTFVPQICTANPMLVRGQEGTSLPSPLQNHAYLLGFLPWCLGSSLESRGGGGGV
jgi:hypothetical protein